MRKGSCGTSDRQGRECPMPSSFPFPLKNNKFFGILKVQSINHHESAIHYPTRSRSKRRAWSRHERGRACSSTPLARRRGGGVRLPGGASMELHQSLTKSEKIRTILPRQEQGGGFMAHGYARQRQSRRVHGDIGSRATNLVTCIADAYMDSIPLVAITAKFTNNSSGRALFRKPTFSE